MHDKTFQNEYATVVQTVLHVQKSVGPVIYFVIVVFLKSRLVLIS